MRTRLLATTVAGLLALSACGGSSGSGGTVPANATVITAKDSITWDAKEYSATAVDGKVTIALRNDSGLPHNLHLLDSSGTDSGLTLTVSARGDISSDSVTLPAGSYKVICTIAGHGNMKATLTVS